MFALYHEIPLFRNFTDKIRFVWLALNLYKLFPQSVRIRLKAAKLLPAIFTLLGKRLALYYGNHNVIANETAIRTLLGIFFHFSFPP